MSHSFGAGSSGSAGAANTSRFDLGPNRARAATPTMPYPANQPNYSSQLPSVSTCRYGSGARSVSRERDRARERSPAFDPSQVAADPGPQARLGWLDALNTFNNRLQTLERTERDHAYLVKCIDEKFIEQHGRINERANTIANNKEVWRC